MGAWMILWGVLGVVLVVLIVAGAVWAARELGHRTTGGAIPGVQTPAVSPPQPDPAQDELRRRYAAGEISREDYLQGRADLQ